MKLIFSFFLSATLTSQVTAQIKYSKDVLNQIKRVENGFYDRLIVDNKTYNILDRMKHYNVSGISVAVIDNYKIVWAKGYGYADKKENRKVTNNTMFEPGSISKSLHAIGVLWLAQQGKLNLYQDINKYLLSWKFPYDTISKNKKITTAQLLSHTAGTSVYGFPGYKRDSVIPSVAEILNGEYPSNTPPVRSVTEPGNEFSYSGGGTLISQQMLVDITKQHYEQFMYSNILKPLGMNNSFYNQPPPAKQQKKLATGYESNGKEVSGKYFVYPEKAAAGLWTTPTDLCKYIIEMQLAYKGQSSKILSQKMAKLHLTPYANESSAMGTFVQDRNGEKYFFHDAGNKGFRGFYIAGLTNGKGVALFVNSENGNILLELLNSVALVYGWQGFAKPEQINTVPINNFLISKYVGDYVTEGILSEVKNEKDGLYYWIDGIYSKMYFTSEQDFRNIEFSTTKSFLLNNNGEVIGFTRMFNGEKLASAHRITDIETLKTNKGQFGIFGRHLLANKDYNKAINFLSKGMAIDPADSSVLKNLAHTYLFKNNFSKAIELYLQYLKSSLNEKELMVDLKNDFEYFSNAGFDEALIKMAKEKLEL